MAKKKYVTITEDEDFVRFMDLLEGLVVESVPVKVDIIFAKN
jgi:hypothetical protein